MSWLIFNSFFMDSEEEVVAPAVEAEPSTDEAPLVEPTSAPVTPEETPA